MYSVVKRDGKIVDYNPDKIRVAIEKANQNVSRRERANEEQTHHQWIVDYLDERGVFFKYPAIAEVNEEFEEHLDVFKLTVAVEEETTKMIYEIVDLATKENDYLTLVWLMHNGNGAKLVAEQSEEMAISELALDIASQDGTWIEKGRTILRAYKGADNN